MNFQIWARDYYIGINISTRILVDFSSHQFFTASLGSVTFPVRDDAATTIGEAK
jgi:hypothetical protein